MKFNKEKVIRKNLDELENKFQQQIEELTRVNEKLKLKIIDFKKTESELQSVQEYLDIILFNIPVGVAILEGPEFRYFRINQVLADLNGLPVEEHLGRSVEEVLPQAAPSILPNLRKVFEKGETIHAREFSIRLPSNHGKEINLIDWHFPIEVDGRIQAIGAIVMDITERKRSEREIEKQHEQIEKANQELKEYQESLEKLVEERTARLKEEIIERKRTEKELRESRKKLIKAEAVARMGFLDWNLKTNEIAWSKEVYNLYGIDPESPVTIEQTVDLVHPDDREFVNKNLDMAMKGITDYNIDHRMVRPDGKVIWVHARADLERDKGGKPISLIGTVVDITERKLAEGKLLKSEERFRSLIEQSPLAIEILTPEGQISQVNPAWMQLWDINEEETVKVLAKYNMLTDEQVKDLGILPLVERAFAGERIVLPPVEYSGNRAAEEMELDDIEARSPWIQCHLYSVKDANGKIAYVVNTYMDITDLKKAEQETKEQRDTLARVDRATRMGQLTGSIAHELNQPLTGILSNAQAAELMMQSDQWESDELEDIIADIIADTKRAGDVIRNLRELYREQKGMFLPVDINNVADEAIKLLHSEFVLQHIIFAKDFSSSIPMVSGNKFQLQQVVVNLIMNGEQAMSGVARSDRRLNITTACDANEVKVWVEDCGTGIDADKIDHIFEPMATWKPGGTGMGLAIGNSIIEAHGGRMWAENKSEGGARVGFTLPVHKQGKKA